MPDSRTPILEDDASLLMKGPFFFPLVLSLVSFAQRQPQAEASHPALQTRVPGAKWPHQHLSSGACAEAPRTTLQFKMAAAGHVSRPPYNLFPSGIPSLSSPITTC